MTQIRAGTSLQPSECAGLATSHVQAAHDHTNARASLLFTRTDQARRRGRCRAGRELAGTSSEGCSPVMMRRQLRGGRSAPPPPLPWDQHTRQCSALVQKVYFISDDQDRTGPGSKAAWCEGWYSGCCSETKCHKKKLEGWTL